MLVLPAPMRPMSTTLRPTSAARGLSVGSEVASLIKAGPAMLRVMTAEVSTCLPFPAKDTQWVDFCSSRLAWCS